MRKQRHKRETYIPQNVTEKREGATKGTEVYFYTDAKGRPCAKGFKGRAQKPTISFYYASEEQREFYVTEWLDKIKADDEIKQARKAERMKPHSLEVGQIMRCSWGHEQTNVDFYQVEELASKRYVILRQLNTQIIDSKTLEMCGKATTTKDDYKGGKFRAHVDGDNCVTISSYQFARPWDGKPTHVSWYG